jgi:hypothetical protein
LATGHRDALLLNVHFHSLAPDGIFELEEEGPARFVPLPPPEDEDVEAILRRVIRRAVKILADYDEEFEDDALAALQAAEAERWLRYPDPFPHVRRSAFLEGFSLHAGVRIHENDREGRERLARYVLRPPLALQRLSRGEDGRLIYRMKRPRAGSLFLVLTPDELVARLATLVPPPRVRSLRYHGIFAPHAKGRKRVVPPPEPVAPAAVAAARKLGKPERPAPARKPARTYRIPWADLLAKVFEHRINHMSRRAGDRARPNHAPIPSVVRARDRLR